MNLVDLALKCGVSSSTVSRALNSDPRISRETSRKILKIAAECNFTLNKRKRPVGRSQVSILLVIPDSSEIEHNPFFDIGEIINAVNSGFESDKTKIETTTYSQLVKWKTQNNVRYDGILFAFGTIENSVKSLLVKRGIPYIFLNRTFDHENYVSCNNFKGIIRLLTHLKKRRIIRPGYLGCPAIPVNQDRFRGYQVGCSELFGGYDPKLVLPVDNIQDVDESTARFFLDKGCDAVVGFNDNFSIRLISAFNTLQVDVPGHISVTGFDCSPLRRMFEPRLTTISLSTFEMGFFAARWLSDNIQHKESRQLRLEVDGQMLVGDSVVKEKNSDN